MNETSDVDWILKRAHYQVCTPPPPNVGLGKVLTYDPKPAGLPNQASRLTSAAYLLEYVLGRATNRSWVGYIRSTYQSQKTDPGDEYLFLSATVGHSRSQSFALSMRCFFLSRSLSLLKLSNFLKSFWKDDDNAFAQVGMGFIVIMICNY